MKPILTTREAVVLARARRVEALREAHWQYLDVLRGVRQVVNSNPRGLQLRPLFGTALLERARKPRPMPMPEQQRKAA